MGDGACDAGLADAVGAGRQRKRRPTAFRVYVCDQVRHDQLDSGLVGKTEAFGRQRAGQLRPGDVIAPDYGAEGLAEAEGGQSRADDLRVSLAQATAIGTADERMIAMTSSTGRRSAV